MPWQAPGVYAVVVVVVVAVVVVVVVMVVDEQVPHMTGQKLWILEQSLK